MEFGKKQEKCYNSGIRKKEPADFQEEGATRVPSQARLKAGFAGVPGGFRQVSGFFFI